MHGSKSRTTLVILGLLELAISIAVFVLYVLNWNWEGKRAEKETSSYSHDKTETDTEHAASYGAALVFIPISPGPLLVVAKQSSLPVLLHQSLHRQVPRCPHDRAEGL